MHQTLKARFSLAIVRLTVFAVLFYLLESIFILPLAQFWISRGYIIVDTGPLSIVDALRFLTESPFSQRPIPSSAVIFSDVGTVASAIVSFFIARSSFSNAIIDWVRFRNEVANGPTAPTGLTILVISVENRLSRLQARSNLIIAIVIVSLISAVFLIVFAGRLTSVDAAAVSNVQTIKDELTSLDRQIDDLNERSARDQAIKDDPQNHKSTRFTDPEVSIEQLNDERIFLTSRRTATAQLLDEAWHNEVAHTTTDKLKDTGFITATFFTRIGVLVVLIFLVQILISLYKYNTRMIAFYSSRLDCFRVWNGSDASDLEALIPLLTPAHVDFGPDPRHPVQYLLESWRGRAARETSGDKSSRRRDPKSAKGQRSDAVTAISTFPTGGDGAPARSAQ
jgi:hypothetical protein